MTVMKRGGEGQASKDELLVVHWICTSCEPDYDYKGNEHEKNSGSPVIRFHNMNDDTHNRYHAAHHPV